METFGRIYFGYGVGVNGGVVAGLGGFGYWCCWCCWCRVLVLVELLLMLLFVLALMVVVSDADSVRDWGFSLT